ncbi:hypothetical protein DM473_09420 [Lactobacillus helveticus]|uniref:hypothetical protein n=1 Tax=Lactobacillus helveticus TaxID=1587 RepID=UPI000C7AF47A|nr:hypothetical protein [Lactobacillus helveticus]AUJ27139.1 hypothetical protein Lh8627_00715 [Lactobacillus helveticus]PXZ09172.1 hypothetical protein DM473_09420 [Lactobacillus helveticus]GFP07413.1 hypothetical protein LHEJCM1005_17050 [Lactobacillus helveticus]
MNNEIKHCNKRLKQGKTPICGIYAFLNGFYNPSNSEKWNKNISEIIGNVWSLAIENDLKKGRCCKRKPIYNFNGKLAYSIVGEFFNSDNLYNFLNEKRMKFYLNYIALIIILGGMKLKQLV